MPAAPVLRLLLVAALLTACADETDSPAGSPAGPSTPAAPSSATAPDSTSTSSAPSPTIPVPPSTEPLPKPAATTLTGPVEGGVEPGCVLLTSGGATWLLLGMREVPTSGTTVTVTGTPAPDLRTTCQQGTPFLVTTTG